MVVPANVRPPQPNGPSPDSPPPAPEENSARVGSGVPEQSPAPAENYARGRPGYARGRPGYARELARALRELQRASLESRQALARRLGVGVSDVAALDQLISSAEPLGPVELGHRLGMRSASATALVDRLERAGHVRRVPHPRDRRRQTLAPTEHALDEVIAALQPLVRPLEAAAAELTPEQAEVVARFLDRATAIMRSYASEGGPDGPAG